MAIIGRPPPARGKPRPRWLGEFSPEMGPLDGNQPSEFLKEIKKNVLYLNLGFEKKGGL